MLLETSSSIIKFFLTFTMKRKIMRLPTVSKFTPPTRHQALLELFVVFLISIPVGVPLGVILLTLLLGGAFSVKLVLSFFVLCFSIVLTIQGLFTLFWMLYAWEDPKEVANHSSPETYENPKISFTALIPARHEEAVIGDTILAVHNIEYPEHLKEIIVLCRADDTKTIQKAREVILELGATNARVETFNDYPINKPHALNHGLLRAKHEVVGIFDAEDEPHIDIYNIINTLMVRENVDVVQSGVQLMNYRSSWFSALNCLEYFFWFKSGLHFFSKVGRATPLGGNTVFFKKEYLEKINGWDEVCLTEDADVGIRLTKAGARIRIVYDERHVTKEETPDTTGSLIKQRTRWNQGFLQVFFKKEWRQLPQKRQKIVTLYILLSPLFQSLLLLYTPFAIVIALSSKLPLLISLISFLPLVLFFLQIITLVVGLYEFSKAYKLNTPFWIPLKVIITFYPYQFVLMISAIRAFYRYIFSVNTWEKTAHINAHRP